MKYEYIFYNLKTIKYVNPNPNPNRVISVKIGQYHGCWWPGSLRRQDISSHDIDYVKCVSPGLTWGRILSTCVISMWSNDIKCKYMFMFPLKNLARKGLRVEAHSIPEQSPAHGNQWWWSYANCCPRGKWPHKLVQSSSRILGFCTSWT